MSHTNNKELAIEEMVADFENRYSYLYQGTVYENGGGNFSPVHESVKHWLRTTLHQELQKAREGERERIEAIFKEHVPPHAMDLEDSVWLKRLLNKAFGHENIY